MYSYDSKGRCIMAKLLTRDLKNPVTFPAVFIKVGSNFLSLGMTTFAALIPAMDCSQRNSLNYCQFQYFLEHFEPNMTI